MHAKVLKALTTMGFRATEARAAVERVRSQDVEPDPSVESVLRAALGVLTEERARSG